MGPSQNSLPTLPSSIKLPSSLNRLPKLYSPTRRHLRFSTHTSAMLRRRRQPLCRISMPPSKLPRPPPALHNLLQPRQRKRLRPLPHLLSMLLTPPLCLVKPPPLLWMPLLPQFLLHPFPMLLRLLLLLLRMPRLPQLLLPLLPMLWLLLLMPPFPQLLQPLLLLLRVRMSPLLLTLRIWKPRNNESLSWKESSPRSRLLVDKGIPKEKSRFTCYETDRNIHSYHILHKD